METLVIFLKELNAQHHFYSVACTTYNRYDVNRLIDYSDIVVLMHSSSASIKQSQNRSYINFVIILPYQSKTSVKALL